MCAIRLQGWTSKLTQLAYLRNLGAHTALGKARADVHHRVKTLTDVMPFSRILAPLGLPKTTESKLLVLLYYIFANNSKVISQPRTSFLLSTRALHLQDQKSTVSTFTIMLILSLRKGTLATSFHHPAPRMLKKETTRLVSTRRRYAAARTRNAKQK